MKRAITISREFGSGGRELGVKLSRSLDIPFYDKDLISMVANECDMSEDAFLHYDESLPFIKDPLDRHYYSSFSTIYQMSMSDQIFLAQSKVIRKLAEGGPCVIVGRCADMVLEDSVNLFIYAKMKQRIVRMNSLDTCVEPITMENSIREIDRKRKDYYQYYTGNEWGKAQNYHLCMESGLVGVDGCLRAVLAYLDMLG